jgi:OOP family OmpA-OmpF porin
LLNDSLVRRALLVSAAILAAILLSTLNNTGKAREKIATAESASMTPRISFEYEKSRLTITGDTSSVAHEAILRQVALESFPHARHDFELRQVQVMPPGWALLTELTLRAVAQTYSATATIDESKVIVRGITLQKLAWDEAAARLEKNLPAGTEFLQEVIELRPGASLEIQCAALFHSTLQGREIEFPQDSTELGSTAFSILDELIEIVADCPAATVAITGHTDASGNELNNQQLSEARANSVLTYMITGGVAAARLQAIGAGSSAPLLDENSAHARQVNRRIELEISFP